MPDTKAPVQPYFNALSLLRATLVEGGVSTRLDQAGAEFGGRA